MIMLGYNKYGQLGLGDSAGEDDDTQDRISPTKLPNIKAKRVIAGSMNSAIIDWSVKTDREEFHSSDDVWMFGRNSHGELGITGTNILNPMKIENYKVTDVAM